MPYIVLVNAVGSYSIIPEEDSTSKSYYVIATVYNEGIAKRICRLLNESGETGQ